MPKNASILRWALPPGVSIAIHTTLIVLLIVVGSRAASLTQEPAKTNRLPLAELEISAPTPTPTPAQKESRDDNQDQSSASQIAARAPSMLDRSARALSDATPVASQAMSVATLEQLSEQSSALSAEPSSAPAPIQFAGVSTGAARSIVYVVDTSGATLTSLSYIRQRLLQSIDRLSPTQRFQVIAFRKLENSTFETATLQSSRGKLPRATRENKQAVADWIAQIPARGQSNPVDGLEAAINLDPDMILLISRGIQRTEAPWAGGLKHVRQRLDELNPINPKTGHREIVIKTIQLLDEDPTGIMRTIGVFHGDGYNDYQIIVYNQLTNPDPAPTLPPTTDIDARLTAAEDQLAALKASGVLYRATTAITTNTDQDTITEAMNRIAAILDGTDPKDPRAALLLGESYLLTQTPPNIQDVLRTLDESVFVSPDLDARRRIVASQIRAMLGQTDQAIQELYTLISESDQLKLADLTVGRAVLVLASLTSDQQFFQSGLTNRAPFTTDPAWALMLAETQSLVRFETGVLSPLEPLLGLRAVIPAQSDQIDRSITMLIKHKVPDQTTLPDLARFIYARASLTSGDNAARHEAIDTLLRIADSDDPSLAEESLWLACLGARALNTKEANKVLISAAALLADRFPDHEGAGDALAGAIDAASQTNRPELIDLLRQAIRVFPSRIEIDLWRLQLINLTSDQEQYDLIASLTPATRESDLGAQVYHQIALESAPTDPLAHAINTAALFDRLRSPLAKYWHRAAAELEVDTDPISAAIRLGRLVNKSPNPNDPDLELLYANALLGADQPDQALERLTTLINVLNNHNSKHFWHAWTLIIETTIKQGNAADRANARAHMTRLTLIDPNLGPEPFRSRLINAQSTLHSEP